MQPDRPIFIIGPPRSGTSVLYKTLCEHPDVAYMHRGFKRFPRWPRLGHLLTNLGITSSTPKEATEFWNTFWDGRWDLMTEEHATPEVCEYFRTVVAGVLRATGRQRFVAKCPPHSIRLPWLDAVFPGALFVIAVRDWRAVVSSTVVKRVTDERRERVFWGVRVPGWGKLRDMPSEESAARVFRIVHEMLEEWEPRYPGRVHRVVYRSFCDDPRGVLRGVCEFAGLRWVSEFEEALPEQLRCSNYKWKETLPGDLLTKIREQEGATLDRYTEEALVR